MPQTTVAVSTPVRIDAEHRAQVLDLAGRAADLDGVPPLDDQVRLDLRHPSPTARHLLARHGSELVGYAHVRVPGDGPGSGHLVVAPAHRRRGIGARLVAAMADMAARHPLRLWSHGDLPAAQDFAGEQDFRRVRELWQMAGPLTPGRVGPAYPEGVTVRTFEPGRDEPAWVEVNAGAFLHHPEQGRLTVADLEQRMAEPWFDPAGFFLAERDGELLGFHWTKVHATWPGYPGPVGEVYVLGVSPAAQGLGLGAALTATGMHHLRDRGLDTVILYTEGDNRPAIAVFEKLGLTRAAVDVMYERPYSAGLTLHPSFTSR